MSAVDIDRPVPVRPWMWIAAAAATLVAFAFEPEIIAQLPRPKGRLGDLHMMLRSLGYLPTWIAAGAAMVAWTWRSPTARSTRAAAAVILGSATLSGLLAAILKIVIRRPDIPDDLPYVGWQWMGFGTHPFDGTSFCCPSEHAAVSWGAAVAIARLRPTTLPVVLPLALGTSICRVKDRGHYPADVMVSLLVALAAAQLVDRIAGAERRTAPGTEAR
ncbi:MAG: phosphatase PAP2 family protein [Planctomycetes bacterium]|nr:phosphatase PAP2 family protein [Planctomycetota bacterium]